MRRIRRFAYGAGGVAFVILWLSVIVLGALEMEVLHAKPVAARAGITTLCRALELYADDVGDYPTLNQGLQALLANPGEAKWAGPYLRQDLPLDPWGRPYIYRFNERGITEILTLGRDGKPGGSGQDEDTSSLHLDGRISAESQDALRRLIHIFAFRVAPVCFVGYLIAPSILRRFKAGRSGTCPTRM